MGLLAASAAVVEVRGLGHGVSVLADLLYVWAISVVFAIYVTYLYM